MRGRFPGGNFGPTAIRHRNDHLFAFHFSFPKLFFPHYMDR
jgi:hypothetical protein